MHRRLAMRFSEERGVLGEDGTRERRGAVAAASVERPCGVGLIRLVRVSGRRGVCCYASGGFAPLLDAAVNEECNLEGREG